MNNITQLHTECQACDAYRDNKVAEYCPDHDTLGKRMAHDSRVFASLSPDFTDYDDDSTERSWTDDFNSRGYEDNQFRDANGGALTVENYY